MKSTNRRRFLKLTSLAGISLWGNHAGAFTATKADDDLTRPHFTDRFNMCGYAAPKLDVVRVGFIGLGMRGPYAVERMSYIEGVEIKGLCDLRTEKVEKPWPPSTGRPTSPPPTRAKPTPGRHCAIATTST